MSENGTTFKDDGIEVESSSPLAAALHAEVQRILNSGPFTIQIASHIQEFTEACKRVLAAAGGIAVAIDSIKDDQNEDGQAIAYSSAPETFGARVIQEIVAVLPKLVGARPTQMQSPEALVHALVMARAHGMTDVAAELETKLVGRPLDGERPVLTGIEPYIALTVPEPPMKEEK